MEGLKSPQDLLCVIKYISAYDLDGGLGGGENK